MELDPPVLIVPSGNVLSKTEKNDGQSEAGKIDDVDGRLGGGVRRVR